MGIEGLWSFESAKMIICKLPQKYSKTKFNIKLTSLKEDFCFKNHGNQREIDILNVLHLESPNGNILDYM